MRHTLTQSSEGEQEVKMSTDHLKRCQQIAEQTGGKELAAAIARAIANRKESK